MIEQINPIENYGRSMNGKLIKALRQINRDFLVAKLQAFDICQGVRAFCASLVVDGISGRRLGNREIRVGA